MKKMLFASITVMLLFGFEARSQNHFAPGLDQETKLVKFYPNPAISLITFDFQKRPEKTYTLQIYNFLGKKVYESLSVDQKTVISLSEFFRGIYIFMLKDQNGQVVDSGRFQVTK